MHIGKSQKTLLLLTDAGMLLYWLVVFLDALSLIALNPEYMYSDYQNPLMVAWNLSFLPIDVAFALSGLVALLYPLSQKAQETLITISLTLMFCAGVMALSFWLILEDFNLFWWGVNLWLMALPIAVIVRNRSSFFYFSSKPNF